MEAHGGDVVFENGPQGGARVVLRLPRGKSAVVAGPLREVAAAEEPAAWEE